MIKGTGCDIIEIERVGAAVANKNFLERCFSSLEISMFEDRGSVSFLAKNFAAKEAVVKAAGRGFRGIWPKEIEVLRDNFGAPYVVLTPAAVKALDISNSQMIHISISDTDDMAMATAIIENR